MPPRMRIPAVAIGVLLATAGPVAAQFTSSFGGSFNNQRLHESLVILGSFPIAGVAQAEQARNAGQAKMFREFAGELVKTLIGAPVEKIRLTTTGFRIDE